MAFSGMFSDFIETIADYMGVTDELAAMFMGFIFTIIAIFIIATAVRRKDTPIMALLMTLFMTLGFTVMVWYPLWFGGVIAFALSLIVASFVSKAVGIGG